MPTKKFGNKTIELTHLDKELFPDAGITKGEILDYYQSVADIILPYLQDRPVMVRRFPDGIDTKGFYQKEAADHFPDWFPTHQVKRKQGGSIRHIRANSKAALAYLGQQAAITYHTWLSRFGNMHYPTKLVMDLDPPTDSFEPVRKAAWYMKDIFEDVGLQPYVMTTGSRGLHIVVPLNGKHRFEEARQFIRDVADVAAKQHADELTTEQRKNKRKGRLFLDTNRNSYGQTAVTPYSVRARPGAPVATPLHWDELHDKKLDARTYHIQNITRRLSQTDDPWKQFLRSGRSLKKPQQKLQAIHA